MKKTKVNAGRKLNLNKNQISALTTIQSDNVKGGNPTVISQITSVLNSSYTTSGNASRVCA